MASYKYLGIQQLSSSCLTSHEKGEDAVKQECHLVQRFYLLRLATLHFCTLGVGCHAWGSLRSGRGPSFDHPHHLYQDHPVPGGEIRTCVPQSTANPAVNIELGWKSVQLLVDEAVLRFYHWVTDPSFWGSGLVKSRMDWALSSPTGPYSANLQNLTVSYRVKLADLPSLTPKTILSHWVNHLLARVQSFPSLLLLWVSPPWLNSAQ